MKSSKLEDLSGLELALEGLARLYTLARYKFEVYLVEN